MQTKKMLITSLLLLMIHLSRCIFFEKITKEPTEKIVDCLQMTMVSVFEAPTNLHLITNYHENHDKIVRLFNKQYSLVSDSEIICDDSVKRFIIIENNQQSLLNRFQNSSLAKWSEYLILTKSSYSNVLELANFLYMKEFYNVAFVLITESENITIIQFRSRPKNKENILFTTQCDDELLRNEAQKKQFRRFNRFVCPPSGCSLTYWNLVADAPNNLTYLIYENGTSNAYSVGADMLEDYAAEYQVTVTKDLNNSITETTWEEGVKAVLNGSIDVLFGFSQPTSEVVLPIEVSVWYRINLLGMIYVPEYSVRSTGFASFFLPLEFEVWMSFLFGLLLYGSFLLSVKYIYKKKLIRENLKVEDIVRIFLKQDISEIHNGGLQFVMGLMLIFGFMMTTAYETEITSSFIANNPPILINNMRELWASGRRFGGPKFIRQFLNSSDDPFMMSLYQKYETESAAKMIGLMHFENVVMLHNVEFNNYALWVYRDRFSQRTSRNPFAYYPTLFFTKKDHPYNSLLKHYVLKLHDCGFRTKLQSKYRLGHQLCQECEDNFANPLTISELSTCWFALFIGWIISFLILSTELVVNKLRKMREKRFSSTNHAIQ